MAKNRKVPGRKIVRSTAIALAAVTLALTAASTWAEPLSEAKIREITGGVDKDAIIENGKTSENWLNYGLDYGEKRYSRLNQISTANVGELGLAWYYDLNSRRGVEATPIVVDGIMYVTSSWSIVHAIDARLGEEIWTYDPQVPRDYAEKGCCDIVNRGVALHKGKVYVGTYDGRMVALDAATGQPVWEVDTVIDRDKAYTITGAPRVVNGKVIIGNGGAEYGVRGYITAYDAETGEQAWRWFAVPGDPSKPFEDESMARAALTWDPSGKYWEAGGGGTMWDSMVYDPELNLLYVGTGNGNPWNRDIRSPGGGDNLYLASIVALNPDTGEYVWHYQETPGDHWDYTSTQPLMLADLQIDGRERKVIMHAPKNGFFFVVDRTDGEFISAENFVEVNWAEGYDANGRPIEVPAARAKDKPWETIPSAYGAHNWHPMAFSEQTGLVYIPAQGVPLTQLPEKDFVQDEHKPFKFASNSGWNLGFALNAVAPEAKPYGSLIAWDPVNQREVWRQEYLSPWNGGTLATAGNLVFQGTADGRFVAYDATTGVTLWQTPLGTGAVAGPSTYMIDGKQYVSIAVGWGGVYGVANKATETVGPGRVYTFAVGASGEKPKDVAMQAGELVQGVEYDPEHVTAGTGLYVSSCAQCHGVPGVQNGGNVPNLGFTDANVLRNLPDLVLSDTFVQGGMPDFTGRLSKDDVVRIQAFIQATADAVRPK
ncbi:PQQ-dependent dehydrogenase, methanol/ethanol family [Minwuia thermotolerans]|uniref:PQQ-dependent dehydrogenase, methanol/ethanol family n=1 Tax=Minwuia thermotolerans TaxID=2056226 RepID=A0A2M9FYE3_9PROT|nr:PQQ-dependent dehydrogenase, methanol/ethanol family [Minwuia thermotolerans]